MAVLVAAALPMAQAQSVAPRSAASVSSASSAQGTALIGGNGLLFNGSDGRVFIPHRGAQSVTTALTVEAWVRPDGAFVNDGGLVTKGTSDSPWSFTTTGDGRLHLVVNRSTTSLAGTHFYSTARLALGTWQHVAVALGGGSVRFYIDGQPAGETAAAVTLIGSGDLLVLGADYPLGYDYFRGGLDEVRVWNTARTAQQVRESRNRVLPATSTGLVGFWDFEAFEDLDALESQEGMGTPGVNDVRDRTANAAHGDVVGGVSLVATSYAPPSVRATYDLYEDQVVVAWNAGSTATARHQIRRDGLLLTTLAAGDTTYTDRAGVAGRAYPYCVTRVEGTTLTDLGCDDGRRQLLAPATVAASDGTYIDRVRVTWSDRSAVNTGYRVYRAGALVATVGDVVAFDDTTRAALAPETAYSFCVAPVQGAGEGPRVCDSGLRGRTLPAATVRASDGTQPVSTLVAWADPGTGTTGFTVTRDGTPLAALAASARQFRDVTGAVGTVYTYCVVRQEGAASSTPACDAGGQGTMLAVSAVAASDSTRDDRIEVRWPNTASTESGYRVHRSGGGGLAFDGVDDRVTAPAFTRNPVSGRLTVEAWVRPDALVPGAGIVTKGVSAATWSLTTAADGSLAWTYRSADTGAPVTVGFAGPLAVGVWSHVAVAMSETTAEAFVNGVSVGRVAVRPGLPATSEALVLGADLPGADEFWRGALDEVRLWSTVRTQAEIRAAMFAAATGQEDGLLALYAFDDGPGALATDTRGGLHGRLDGFGRTATSGWVADVAPVAAHRVRPALALDGAGSYATVSGLALPASFTVEFWARRSALGRADVAVGHGTTAPGAGFDAGFGADNRFVFGSGAAALASPAAFGDLAWHHWAVTYDRATGVRTIVRDGAEIARDTAPAPYSGTGDLWLGRSTAGDAFAGTIADVRLWSRARPAASIGAGRYALADTARAGLVGSWALDALDASGTGALAAATGTGAAGLPPATLAGAARLTGAGRPVLAALLPPGSTSFTDATVEPGLSYTYCVQAYATDGADTPAACDSGTRARAVAPAFVAASDGTFEDRVTVGWMGASSRVATYSVYRGTTLLATLPATRTSYDDLGAAPTATHAYCVTASTADGTESARVCDPGSRVLKAPTVAATDDTREDRVEVTWTDNSGAETGYRVTRRPEKAFALALPVSTAGVALPATPAYDFGAAGRFTVEAWVRPTTTSGTWTIVSRDGVAGPGTSGGFSLGILNGYVLARAFDARGEVAGFAGTAPVGAWTHVAMTYVVNGQLILYVNGAEVGRAISGATFGSSPAPIRFGATATSLPGQIDELRLWNTVRSGAEIAAARLQALPGALPGLVGAWAFDDGAGSFATDGSGLAAHLALGSATWSERTDGVLAPATLARTAAGVTTYLDRTAASGQRYVYGVTPFDALGDGTPAEDDGRRVQKAPSALTVTSTPNETNIALAWTDNSATETRQRLVRRSGTDAVVIDIDRNVVAYRDTTVVAGTDYAYSLAAIGTYGVSASSETASSRTILLPASSVSASDTYAASVVVQWVDASAFETGYRVYRDGALLATTAPGVDTYTDATAAMGTAYAYCVATLRGTAEAARVCDSGARTSTALPATTALGRLTNQVSPNELVDGDRFGKKVAVQGDYAIVGAPFKYTGGKGAVAFLKRSTSGWDLLSLQGQSFDCTAGELGWDVTMDGQYAAAGCWSDRNTAAGTYNTGSVFLFHREGDAWTMTQRITAPTSTTDEFFGISVEMQGDHLLVGTRLDRVYAYRRNSNQWAHTGTLTPSGTAGGAQRWFGENLAMDGTTAVVGAPYDSEVAYRAGAAYVFTRTGDIWTAQAKITVPGGVSGDNLGDDVAVHGDIVLAAATGTDDAGSQQGSAYQFKRTGSTWAQVARLRAASPTDVAFFGYGGVALTNDYALIGAPQNSDLANRHGTAYLFERNGDSFGTCVNGTCVETQRVGPQTLGTTREAFAMSAAGDGEVLMVGAGYMGPNRQGAVFPSERSARPGNVQASDGSYASRVQVTWTDLGNHEEAFRIYRNGQKVGDVAANVRTFDDFDALPGDLATYCVASFRQTAGESGQVCDLGWRPSDGRITGRVATSSDAGTPGAGVADVNVCLAPPPNRALLLDGTGSYAQAPSVNLGGDELTVEYWFKGSALQSAVRQQGSGGWIVAGHGTTTLRHLLSNDGGANGIAVGAAATDGAWHHVAMTWKRNTAGGFRSYLDGVLVEARTSTNTPIPNMAAPLYIGAYDGTGEYANGQIDEVRVWKRARTQAELQATMRSPLSGKEDGLAVYLPFDQGEGPAALDMTASAAHAALRGGSTWTDQAAPLSLCATSDATGAFSLAGVRYGTGQAFKVEASKPGVPANTALALDGTANAVRVAGVSTAGDELSVAYWFRGSSLMSAVRQQSATSSANFIVAGWNGLHVLSNDGGTAAGLPVGAAATDGAWHHVAMTWKKGAPNGFVSYLDGEVVAQRTPSASATPIPTIAADVFVGSWNGASEFTNGQIDEVRVWQRALTQAEMRAEMTAATAAPDRLVLALPFSEGAGATARNAARSGSSASIGGAATWATRALATPAHQFQPALQVVALSAASPVQNGVAFTDVSTYAVAGRVRYNTTSPRTGQSYGVCGVPGATVSVPGVPSVVADDSGDYSLALQPGRHVLTVAHNGLAFAPETRTLDLTGDVAAQDFVAGPLRRLILRTETAGGFAIGTHTARIRSEDGCYDRTVTTDATSGLFLDELPPLKYTVQVTGTVLKPNTGLDQVEVDRYFDGLGAQAVDLTAGPDTLAMAYHAPLRIALDGLPTADKQTCAAPGKLGLPTLSQGLALPLFYEIVEDFGALGSFPAQDVRVRIYDEIADEADTPLDSTIALGSLVLQTAVGQPNVLAGRVVDGVDRSYQKSIQIVATAGTRSATRTDWAVVTGTKARNGSFVSLTTNPVPLYVLRDPPGDGSYSYLEKGSKTCFTLADWSTSNQFGTVSNFTSLFGAHAAFGIGVAIESRVGIGAEGSGAVNMSWRREGSTEVCLDAKERFATSADPAFVGEDADVFLGASFNMLYAQTDEIRVNAQTCAIEPSTGFGVAPDPTRPISSAYAYSARHIRDVLLPQLKTLRAAAAPTDTTRYGTYIDNWQHHLDRNASLRRPVVASGTAEQKSFSGGTHYAASFTADTTYYHAWSTQMYTQNGIGLNNIIKTPASETSGGWQLRFTRETTFELPGFVGAPRFNGREAYTGTRTTGYVLADKDAGDQYAVNVRPESAEEVQIYVPTRRTDESAIGYGLTTAAQLTGKVTQKLIAAFATQAGKVASQRSNVLTSVVGTSIDLAFGLSQGIYDLSALLDPENTTSAAVETRMRVPFGSPVFELVAGSSSCPWLPDPTFSAGGGVQKGTLRRDLPTLALGRTSLVGADPNRPAVFSLFLGNASESSETRRYVLRAVNERNPGGATLRVNGVALGADGMVFAIPAGRQIEATLSVERGPTRFRYDSLEVLLAPECPGLDLTIAEREASRQTFSVSFKSVSSPVTLYTSPRFDLDFGALAEANPGDSLALADFTLETLDHGQPGTTDDDVYLTEVGMQYRPAGTASWTTAFAATRAQIVAASPQGDAATTYYTRWKPRAGDVDGAYEFRAYTRSTGGGPGGAFFYGDVLAGRIDRKGPLVFGTPEPADEVLALGDDLRVTFDEAVAPASVRPDSAAAASPGANVRLLYADGAEAGQRLRVRTVVSGAGVVIAPVGGWAALEGRRLTAELRVGGGAVALTDVAGNPLAAAASWSFTVRRSALAWSAPTVRTAVTRGVAPRVTVQLANGRSEAAAFTLSGVPAWLTPSMRSGTIAPGAVQPITFTGADTLGGGTRTATVVATVGPTALPLSITVEVDQTPTWTVDPARFQHSMAVTAQLFVRGRPSVDATDRVAAFVGGELRGVASVVPRTSGGQSAPDSNRVSLLVYSNQAAGEVVTFKVWDDSPTAPVLYEATSRSLVFRADAAEGTPTRPLAVHAPFVPGASAIALNAGWTWVSLPRVPQGATLATVLGPVFGLSPSSGDVVKSQQAFAMYSGSGGAGAWAGPLADSLADPRQAYLVRLAASQELLLSFGGPVADTAQAVPLVAGWNWLGFPRSVAQPLGHALAASSFGTAPVAGDLVKSQTAFAQYVPGSGWVGSLDRLEPGRGYLMRRAAAGTLAYPPAPPSGAALEAPDAASASLVPGEALASDAATPPGWTVDAARYAFNLTAVVALDDATVAAGATLGAFVGDTLRGVATLRTVAGAPRPVAFLMAYGPRASGETLTFRLYDPATGQTTALAATQAFTADATLGTVAAPLVLATGRATGAETLAPPTAFEVLPPAPNPFSDRATLRYALPSAEHVTIDVLDVTGRRVARLVDATQAAGHHTVTIESNGWASGVYLVQVRAGRSQQTMRLLHRP